LKRIVLRGIRASQWMHNDRESPPFERAQLLKNFKSLDTTCARDGASIF